MKHFEAISEHMFKKIFIVRWQVKYNSKMLQCQINIGGHYTVSYSIKLTTETRMMINYTTHDIIRLNCKLHML